MLILVPKPFANYLNISFGRFPKFKSNKFIPKRLPNKKQLIREFQLEIAYPKNKSTLDNWDKIKLILLIIKIKANIIN